MTVATFECWLAARRAVARLCDRKPKCEHKLQVWLLDLFRLGDEEFALRSELAAAYECQLFPMACGRGRVANDTGVEL